jgi:hypothetical protein
VFKPATSKEGNSEVYVVCLEYKGRAVMEPWLEVLRTHFGKDVCALDCGACYTVGRSVCCLKGTCLPASTLSVASVEVEVLHAWLY